MFETEYVEPFIEANKLLQNLAMFYMWSVKQKDDGMDQSTLYCCYGDCLTTSQQT